VKVGILGGGVAGVQMAINLSRHNDVTILEANRIPGGLCRSFQFMNFSYDVGPHILFSKEQKILDYILQTAPELLIKHKRSNQIMYKGRKIKYPFENNLGALSSDERDWCLSRFINNPYKDLEPKNMLQFFLSYFGEGITNTYLRPYNEKIWKFDPSYLDLQMVERIPRPPAEDVLSGARGESKEGYVHQLHFYYPQSGGVGAFFKKMVEQLPTNVELQVSKRIKVLRPEADGYLVELENGPSHRFDKIINCMPAHELIACMDAEISVEDDLSAYADKLKYNSLYYGLLVYSKDNAGNNFSFNFPEKEMTIHRASLVNFLGNHNFRDQRAFLCEATYREGTEMAGMAERDLVEKFSTDLEYAGLASRCDFVGAEIRAEKYAYVMYDINHRKNKSAYLNCLRGLGIPSCGRFAEFEYYNIDHVVGSALQLCGQLNRSWN
tara:strand:+ start:589 stop:1902 length:1314 start_codon:yes stop_codon:yes gene_type:complete